MTVTYMYCEKCYNTFSQHWEDVEREYPNSVDIEKTEDMLFCNHPGFKCDFPADFIVTVKENDCNHSWRYTGTIPCTGPQKCVKCGEQKQDWPDHFVRDNPPSPLERIAAEERAAGLLKSR